MERAMRFEITTSTLAMMSSLYRHYSEKQFPFIPVVAESIR